jgi:hypothetical protein
LTNIKQIKMKYLLFFYFYCLLFILFKMKAMFHHLLLYISHHCVIFASYIYYIFIDWLQKSFVFLHVDRNFTGMIGTNKEEETFIHCWNLK